MPAKVEEVVSGQNESGLLVPVIGLLILRNLPEDVIGLTTKKQLNKYKKVLKIRTPLGSFNFKALPFRYQDLIYRLKSQNNQREEVLPKSSNSVHCLENYQFLGHLSGLVG